VLSNDGSIVYAMFHTIADSRTALTDEAMVTFRETPEGVAPAVKSLFYGGEYRGYEFVYPKGGGPYVGHSAPALTLLWTRPWMRSRTRFVHSKSRAFVTRSAARARSEIRSSARCQLAHHFSSGTQT
jgi:hypothetical protein